MHIEILKMLLTGIFIIGAVAISMVIIAIIGHILILSADKIIQKYCVKEE